MRDETDGDWLVSGSDAPPLVLLVDDERQITDALRRSMRGEPFEVLTAASAEEALRILEQHPVDVVVSDERMPGMNGSELLARVRRLYPETIRMMLTGRASIDTAMRAINEGEIYRFFTKPRHETELLVAIRQALRTRRLADENARLRREVATRQALLERLEEENPGLTSVRTDGRGVVLIDADDL